MASGPSEEAETEFLEVHKWLFEGSAEHVAGLQSAVVGDVIHDEHVGYANFIFIVGENPRQQVRAAARHDCPFSKLSFAIWQG